MKFSDLKKHDTFEFTIQPGIWFVKVDDQHYKADETPGNDKVYPYKLMADNEVNKIGDEPPTVELEEVPLITEPLFDHQIKRLLEKT